MNTCEEIRCNITDNYLEKSMVFWIQMKTTGKFRKLVSDYSKYQIISKRIIIYENW